MRKFAIQFFKSLTPLCWVAFFSSSVLAQWPPGHPCGLPLAQRPKWCPPDVDTPTPTPPPTVTPWPTATPNVPPTATPSISFPTATPIPGVTLTPTPGNINANIVGTTITIQRQPLGTMTWRADGQLLYNGIPVVGVCIEFVDKSKLTPCSGPIKK